MEQKNIKKDVSLWNRDFILILQGQAVSSLGDALYTVIIALWLYDATGSAAMTGVLYAVMNFTRLLCLPVSGLVVDRFDRRNLIVLCDAARGVCMMLLGVLTLWRGASGVWLVLVYGVLSSFFSSVFNPAANALILSIVHKKQFVRANSVYYMANYGVDIIGQALAGGAYVLFGAPMMFLVNGVTFLLSALSELFIRRQPPERTDSHEKQSVFQDAVGGAVYIWRHRGIRLNLILAMLNNLCFGALSVLLVPWMLQFGAECYGLLGAFKSAGTILGACTLTLVQIPDRYRYKVFFLCLVAHIACVAAASLMPAFWLIALLFFTAYGGQYVFNSLQRAMVTIQTPDNQRGKVFSALQALAMSASGIGNLLAGAVSQLVVPQALVLVLMLVSLAASVLLGSRPAMKQLIGEPLNE